MDRRVMLALALTVLVGLAGCASSVSDGTGTETNSSQALESETATVTSFSYPEGATPSGITDVESLLDAHEAALSGTGVTLVGNETFRVSAMEQSDDAGFSYSVAHVPDTGETLTTITSGEDNVTTAYVSGGTQYYRQETATGTEYRTADAADTVADGAPESYTGRELLSSMLGAGTYNATEVVSRNGTELVKYELQELTAAPDDTIQLGEVTSAEGTVYVDTDGVVHEASISVSTGGGLFTLDQHVAFIDIGSTSVEEPAWTDRAN